MTESEKDKDNKNAAGTETTTVLLNEKGTGGKNYIMTIGVNEYAKSKWNLDTCEEDCKGLTKILTEKYGFTSFKSLLSKDATRKNIQDMFTEFRELDPGPDDNLIIYFSGHGYIYKLDPDPGIGCWVTHEAENLDPNDLYQVVQLIQEVKRLNKMRHILVISDCCHSGTILEEPTFYGLNTRSDDEAQSLDEMPSRWAICSSRSNEKSASGRIGELSKFTNMLVEQLTGNNNDRLYLKTLLAELEVKFDDLIREEGQKWQRPFSSSLNIISKNSGQFIFRPAKDLAIIGKRAEVLQRQLQTLNYTPQLNAFAQIEAKGRAQFTIFTGRPTCGLGLLSYKAKRLLSDIPITYPVSLDKFKGDGENRVINGLKAAFNLPDPQPYSLQELKQEVISRLSIAPAVIELRFYIPDEGALGTIPAASKKNLIDELSRFTDLIDQAKPKNRFFIFVLDYECCDYETLYNSSRIGNTDTTFVPRTTPIQLAELSNWYSNMELAETALGQKLKPKEFRDLFFEPIRSNFQTMIDETNGFPGSMLQKICEKAKCDDLADRILDPDNN
ncbi:MAG TPA: caspase family protein [Chitinophagaceae bacterium]|jgi:hypothetical protein|nr:caspase family protein [Chitinophagaceae bacterium]